MSVIYQIRLKDISAARSFTHLFRVGNTSRFIVSRANLEYLKMSGVKLSVITEFNTGPIEQHIIYPFRNFLYSPPDALALDEICAKIKSLAMVGKQPYAIFLGRNPELEAQAFILDGIGRKRNYQWKIVYTKAREKSLERLFPKLIKQICSEDTKVVLSFGAGGLRFFAHASVMKFINAIRARSYVDEVWGCSGGAFSAYAYAMGVSPDDIEQKGYDIYNGRADLKLATSKFTAIKNLIIDAIFPASPSLLKEYAQLQMTMCNALTQLVAGRKLEVPFYCTAYNVRKEHNDVLTPLPLLGCYKNFIFQADPIESIVASSTIPIIYIPKMIKTGKASEQYIEGSIAEDIPLLPVYRKWVIDKKTGLEKRKKLLIIAINTFPEIADRPWLKGAASKKIPFGDLIRFGLMLFDLVINIRFDERFESLSQDRHVRVIKVNLPLQTPALLDCKAIPKIIYNAQMNLIQKLREVERAL